MAEKFSSADLRYLDDAFKRFSADNIKAMQLLSEQSKSLQGLCQQAEYICQSLLTAYNQCCALYSSIFTVQKKPK